MIATVSTTRWRDEPILPKDYDDIAALVKIARKARNRTVEFDWAFTQEGVRHLRRAAYEWGSHVQGGYKAFDARVLAAINAALGETDSVFVLNAPKGTQGMNCAVAFVRDGNMFRLRGHATFDI